MSVLPFTPPRPPPRRLPELAGVWPADAWRGAGARSALGSGHAALDAELPGGGWPRAALIELLLPAVPGSAPVWPLLLPALRAQRAERQAQRRAGWLALVGLAEPPFVPALAAAGLAPDELLWVPARAPADALWATEQALRCPDVGAVLSWLPQAHTAGLQRLHLAAAHSGDGLLWAIRPAPAAAQASPAPLRLQLAPGAEEDTDTLALHLLKRRGPPLARAITLPAQGPWLRRALALPADTEALTNTGPEDSHAPPRALDRLAMAA